MSAGGHILRNRIELRNGKDLNNYTVPGIFALHHPANAPGTADYIVEVYLAKTSDGATTWVSQIVTDLADNIKSTRIFNGTWGSYTALGVGSGSAFDPSTVNITGGAISGVTITGLADPSGASDAATKAYVDAITAGIGGTRVAVRAATTGNITIATALNNGDTLDGIVLATNDLVLVKDQTLPKDNGIYVVGVSPARSTAFDTMTELAGMLVVVRVGTANAGTLWFCTSPASATINTDPVTIDAIHIVGTNLSNTPSATDVVVGSSTGASTDIPGATPSLAGVMSAADKAKLNGISAGAQVNDAANLSFSRTATTVTVASDTGTDAVLPAADSTHAGVLTAADKAKLDLLTDESDLSIDLSIGTHDSDTVQIAPSRGAAVDFPMASESLAGAMTADDKTKLDGIATGAQVNVATNIRVSATDATSVSLASSTGSGCDLPLADHDNAGLMSAADKIALDNGGGGGGGGDSPTDLSIGTVGALTVQVQSSTGASATIPAATDSLAGVLSGADKTKIDALLSAAFLDVDTDPALGANSDAKIATQKAVKAYVTAQLAGSAGLRLQVRVATTANITISTALNNGDSLDGITLATNDLVLVKNQTLPAQNGVYVVGVSPGRYSGLNTFAEFIGAVIAVSVGTVNAGTIWFSLASGAGTIDVTDITFAGLTVAGTDLGLGTLTATTVPITSSTGATATIPLATSAAGTNKAGLISPAEKDAVDALGTASTATLDTSTALGTSDTHVPSQKAVKTYADALKLTECIIVAVGDEITPITTGTAKLTFRMPYAFTLTDIRASLTIASASGNPLIDVKESGSTIFSTKLSIDATELTSTTAVTPAVISDASLADDAQITIDINTAGSGATGLKIAFIGHRT